MRGGKRPKRECKSSNKQIELEIEMKETALSLLSSEESLNEDRPSSPVAEPSEIG